ncbi:hypothetical protein PQX77_002748 [Marasmius sp. AFHP31]|nr:hypothetical protein PQX77_002748 [Marasmius sp. AFHP31]
MFKVTLLLLQVAQSLASATQTSVVDLGYARYQGVFNGTVNVTNFLGLRYAAAPVGDLRWESPSPPGHLDGVQQANSQPPQCPQASGGSSPTNPFSRNGTQKAKRQSQDDTNEDCLFLNVHFSGDTAPSEKLPVIVWIHGGGYIAGNASRYDGSDLISRSHSGIVVVVIQYRLGLFGFLSGNAVYSNGALNAGLLDQHFALRWVNKHIHKFGGDPTRVTIWGESAGAGSVLQQVIAEDGQTQPPLFRGAITSSTFLPSQYAFNDSIPEALYTQVVDSVGCSFSSDTLKCLRDADTNTLQTANAKINLAGFFGTFTFVPVVDGTFIKQRPIEALKQGKVNGEALLAFASTNEGNVFVNQTATPLSASQYAGELFPLLGQEETMQAGELYVGLGPELVQENLIQGETIFICPTYYLLSAFKDRAYKGEFALPPALHAGDIVFNWPSLGVPVTFNNTNFIDAFTQSFISFAVSLDPNVKTGPSTITPPWDLYSINDTEMVFNKTVDEKPDVRPVTTNEGLLQRCSFWESVGALTGQ